jgi:hypothetical protein
LIEGGTKLCAASAFPSLRQLDHSSFIDQKSKIDIESYEIRVIRVMMGLAQRNSVSYLITATRRENGQNVRRVEQTKLDATKRAAVTVSGKHNASKARSPISAGDLLNHDSPRLVANLGQRDIVNMVQLIKQREVAISTQRLVKARQTRCIVNKERWLKRNNDFIALMLRGKRSIMSGLLLTPLGFAQ